MRKVVIMKKPVFTAHDHDGLTTPDWQSS